MKTTQLSELYGDWKGEVSQDKINELNEDFQKMDIPLKVYYESTPDGWTLRFIKESEN
jgi:hypothetical protein